MGRLGSLALAGLAACCLCGCDSTVLSPDEITLTGLWSGQLSDSSGPGRFTWELTQDGASFSGSGTIEDPDTSFRARGTISGSVFRSTLRFSMHIPAGGFDDPFGTCSADVTGDGQINAGSVTGQYSGTNSCSGPITSGQFTLAKQ
jgi:hypothetical protein